MIHPVIDRMWWYHEDVNEVNTGRQFVPMRIDREREDSIDDDVTMMLIIGG